MRAALLVHIGWLKGGRDYATILGHEVQIFPFFSPTGHQCHGRGINNKIQSVKKKAYGFRNTQRFIDAIYFHRPFRQGRSPQAVIKDLAERILQAELMRSHTYSSTMQPAGLLISGIDHGLNK